MRQPKSENFSKEDNSKPTWFIAKVAAAFLLTACFGISFAGFVAPASATESVRDTPIPADTAMPIAIGDPADAFTSPTTGTVREPLKLSIDKHNSLWVVVNKQRPLSYLKYVPKGLVAPPFKYPNTHNPYAVQLTKDAGIALVAMAKAMAVEGGGTLVASSGYRSYVMQQSVHSRQVARYGLKVGEALAARPGFSEHQTGLAVDVYAAGQDCRIYTCFANTVAGKWLANNAHRFGFVLRYQQNQASVTGYQFEPWHFRYVGQELAANFKTSGKKSLEAYFKLPAAPSY